MYKIVYINGTALHLMPADARADWPVGRDDHLLARYPGKRKFLLHYVDLLEKTDRYEAVGLYAADPEALWNDLRSQFQWVEAAGGLVRRPDGRTLFIFRRGHWDLPKGKIDPGETRSEAALREVREETGLRTVRLGEPFDTTFHTYRLEGGQRVLKPTYWYIMETEEEELRPEAREGIELAIWMPVDQFLREKRPLYNSLRGLLGHYRERYPPPA